MRTLTAINIELYSTTTTPFNVMNSFTMGTTRAQGISDQIRCLWRLTQSELSDKQPMCVFPHNSRHVATQTGGDTQSSQEIRWHGILWLVLPSQQQQHTAGCWAAASPGSPPPRFRATRWGHPPPPQRRVRPLRVFSNPLTAKWRWLDHDVTYRDPPCSHLHWRLGLGNWGWKGERWQIVVTSLPDPRVHVLLFKYYY